MVVGSNPTGPTIPVESGASDELASASGPVQSGGHAHNLEEAISTFVLSRQVANCSSRTIEMYRANLGGLQKVAGDTTLAQVEPLAIQQYLTTLRERMKPISAYQHFVCLRTFFSWCVGVGLLTEHPMRGITMRIPKTLPRVPEDEYNPAVA